MNIEFPRPFTAQALTVSLDVWDARLVTLLEVSDDGEHYRTVRPMSVLWPVTSVNFDKVTAR